MFFFCFEAISRNCEDVSHRCDENCEVLVNRIQFVLFLWTSREQIVRPKVWPLHQQKQVANGSQIPNSSCVTSSISIFWYELRQEETSFSISTVTEPHTANSIIEFRGSGNSSSPNIKIKKKKKFVHQIKSKTRREVIKLYLNRYEESKVILWEKCLTKLKWRRNSYNRRNGIRFVIIVAIYDDDDDFDCLCCDHIMALW